MHHHPRTPGETPDGSPALPEVHENYGPEAAFAVRAEAGLPTTRWEEEIARGLEMGLPGADSIVDRRIPTFSRGELPHFAGINTFLKAPYLEDLRRCGEYDSAVGGGLMILGTLLAAPDIMAPELSTQGIASVLTALAGPFWGPVVLGIVGISIFSAALALSTSATRVMFSMARDGQLPFAKALAHVSSRTRTPILPGIVVGVLSIGVLLINFGQTSVFATVTGSRWSWSTPPTCS